MVPDLAGGPAAAGPRALDARRGPEAQAILGVLGTGANLVVVAEDGRAWSDAAAVVMCLWATGPHRELASRLQPPLRRMGAEAFFHALIADPHVRARLLQRAHMAPARAA